MSSNPTTTAKGTGEKDETLPVATHTSAIQPSTTTSSACTPASSSPTVPSTPTSILRPSHERTLRRNLSVSFNLDNHSLSTFRCVSCRGRFNMNQVEVLSCDHYICLECTIEIMCGEGDKKVLKRCSGCRELVEQALDQEDKELEKESDAHEQSTVEKEKEK